MSGSWSSRPTRARSPPRPSAPPAPTPSSPSTAAPTASGTRWLPLGGQADGYAALAQARSMWGELAPPTPPKSACAMVTQKPACAHGHQERGCARVTLEPRVGGSVAGVRVGHLDGDAGALAGGRLDGEMAADHLDPFAHAGQAEMALAEQLGGGDRVEADPVVVDAQVHRAVPGLQRDRDPGRAGVLAD